MQHSLKSNLGIKTFGVHKEPLYAGEYINAKKARASFCGANKCNNSIVPTQNGKLNTQGNLLMLNRANNLNYYAPNNVKNGNLYISLITKLDLEGVPVICRSSPPNMYVSPASLDKLTSYPYIFYHIDPSGNLFGNTNCRAKRFLNYLIYNPPYTISNPGFVNHL
jgi:hypothetical protein